MMAGGTERPPERVLGLRPLRARRILRRRDLFPLAVAAAPMELRPEVTVVERRIDGPVARIVQRRRDRHAEERGLARDPAPLAAAAVLEETLARRDQKR